MPTQTRWFFQRLDMPCSLHHNSPIASDIDFSRVVCAQTYRFNKERSILLKQDLSPIDYMSFSYSPPLPTHNDPLVCFKFPQPNLGFFPVHPLDATLLFFMLTLTCGKVSEGSIFRKK